MLFFNQNELYFIDFFRFFRTAQKIDHFACRMPSNMLAFSYITLNVGCIMQKGHRLQFKCLGCKELVEFSVFELESENHTLGCVHCNKNYVFNDSNLLRQLKKFENLCRTIKESEEILGLTAVGVDVGNRRVKIPYKLLLTRMSSSLDLKIGGEPVSISFRIEPGKDIPDPND